MAVVYRAKTGTYEQLPETQTEFASRQRAKLSARRRGDEEEAQRLQQTTISEMQAKIIAEEQAKQQALAQEQSQVTTQATKPTTPSIQEMTARNILAGQTTSSQIIEGVSSAPLQRYGPGGIYEYSGKTLKGVGERLANTARVFFPLGYKNYGLPNINPYVWRGGGAKIAEKALTFGIAGPVAGAIIAPKIATELIKTGVGYYAIGKTFDKIESFDPFKIQKEGSKQEYKQFKESGESAFARDIIQRNLYFESKKDNIFWKFTGSILPQWSSKQAKEKGFEDVYKTYIERGYSPKEAEKMTKFAYKEFIYSGGEEASKYLFVGSQANVLGGSLSASPVFKNIINKYKSEVPKFILKALPVATAGGVIEGPFYTETMFKERAGRSASAKELGLGAGLGFVSSGVIDVALRTFPAVKTKSFSGRTGQKLTEATAYIGDPFEAPADFLTGLAGKSASGTKKVFTYSPSLTPTYTKTIVNPLTKERTDVKPFEPVEDLGVPIAPSKPVSKPINKPFTIDVPIEYVSIGSRPRSDSRTQPSPQPSPRPTTEPLTRTSTMPIVPPLTKTNVAPAPMVQPLTNTKPSTFVKTNVFTGGALPIKAFPSGVGGGGFRITSRGASQPRRYTPTLYAVVGGIKAPKGFVSGKQGFLTGLELRPIGGSNSKKKKRF